MRRMRQEPKARINSEWLLRTSASPIEHAHELVHENKLSPLAGAKFLLQAGQKRNPSEARWLKKDPQYWIRGGLAEHHAGQILRSAKLYAEGGRLLQQFGHHQEAAQLFTAGGLKAKAAKADLAHATSLQLSGEHWSAANAFVKLGQYKKAIAAYEKDAAGSKNETDRFDSLAAANRLKGKLKR